MPRIPILLTVLAAALLLAGCATKPFPQPYLPDAEHASLSSSKTFLLVPSFDDRPQEERALLDPKFNAVSYVDDMLSKECGASGLKSEAASFPHGAGFDGIAEALRNSPAPEGAVVLSASLRMMPSEYIFSCDVRLFSNKGETLFEKRGICLIIAVTNGENLKRSRELFYGGRALPDEDREDLRRMSARSAMRQIFSDPAFRKAIQ